MKIKKSQLKEIIKECIKAVLKEKKAVIKLHIFCCDKPNEHECEGARNYYLAFHT